MKAVDIALHGRATNSWPGAGFGLLASQIQTPRRRGSGISGIGTPLHLVVTRPPRGSAAPGRARPFVEVWHLARTRDALHTAGVSRATPYFNAYAPPCQHQAKRKPVSPIWRGPLRRKPPFRAHYPRRAKRGRNSPTRGVRQAPIQFQRKEIPSDTPNRRGKIETRRARWLSRANPMAGPWSLAAYPRSYRTATESEKLPAPKRSWTPAHGPAADAQIEDFMTVPRSLPGRREAGPVARTARQTNLYSQKPLHRRGLFLRDRVRG